MIELLLGPDDLARIRFAGSHLEELVNSLRVLSGRRTSSVHQPWLRATRPRMTGIDLELLFALAGSSRFIADFLAPPIDLIPCGFDTELEWVRGQSAEAVRSALDELRDGAPLPPVLRKLYDHPETGLGAVAGALKAYWQEAIEPAWPRLSAMHQADISYRMGHLATGGFVTVFENLHPEVEFAGDRLLIHKPHHQASRAPGSGLLLLPTVFSWPQLCVSYNPPYQPSLAYAPRGIGQVWTTATAPAEPLGDLLGRNRANLLAHLDLPLSTSQLAGYLEMSAPAVSQHLAILRRCQLVTSRRSGRWVLHQRTELATSLLKATLTSQ